MTASDLSKLSKDSETWLMPEAEYVRKQLIRSLEKALAMVHNQHLVVNESEMRLAIQSTTFLRQNRLSRVQASDLDLLRNFDVFSEDEVQKHIHLVLRFARIKQQMKEKAEVLRAVNRDLCSTRASTQKKSASKTVKLKQKCSSVLPSVLVKDTLESLQATAPGSIQSISKASPMINVVIDLRSHDLPEQTVVPHAGSKVWPKQEPLIRQQNQARLFQQFNFAMYNRKIKDGRNYIH